jgi:hypothetical protein
MCQCERDTVQARCRRCRELEHVLETLLIERRDNTCGETAKYGDRHMTCALRRGHAGLHAWSDPWAFDLIVVKW